MREITTPRLRIANFSPEEWKDLQRMIIWYMSSPFASFDHQWPVSDEEMKGICTWVASTDDFLAVRLREDNRFIGYVCLSPTGEEDTYNLGYCIHGPFHKNGYAYESCQALVDFAFRKLGAKKIISGTADENRPSVKLLKKLGFSVTGSTTGSFRQDEEGKPIEFTGCEYALVNSKISQK